jgi:small G protein signaling modulator 3
MRREFDRLVRNGIPLVQVYRSKVWMEIMECSGALDMKEPGLFQDLAQMDGPDSVIGEMLVERCL